ncbi:glycoside hydrolase [Sphingomonas desiccabilis]|uniref:glycoside hydrolase n=1 Tax=Sphingomonas desiccabilis TaxID=429134 RepID=UPI0018315B3E|nr:glycoside hydrolase [Sphingomonas desiccabilis]MBB3911506.1 hypothetical protein [Sphingomonas desiccabilis]
MSASGEAAGQGIADYAVQAIRPPPSELNLDPFYKRYADAGGIPVIASAKVPDLALLNARDIATVMLLERPDIRQVLIARGTRVAIMAIDEGTVDLPEHRDWKKPARDDPRLTRCERKHYDARIGRLSDRAYWNGRARGMGGIFTSGAAENLMGVPGTRYYGENILVHEFSHNILEGVRGADPLLYGRVERAYAAARAAGRWQGEYAETTVDEYWAEGTQFWFNSNRLAVIDGRRVLSANDLLSYDPALYAVLEEVYGRSHRLEGDVFYQHPARVPPGPVPKSTAEIC